MPYKKKEKQLEADFVAAISAARANRMTFQQLAERTFPYDGEKKLAALLSEFPGFEGGDSIEHVNLANLAKAVAEQLTP